MTGALLAVAILMPGATPDTCNLACERQSAVRLLERGQTRAAIERLKEARGRFPEDRHLILLLARSYLMENNLFWAERTLREAVEMWPDDFEFRAWLASVHLRQGDPDLLRDDLPPRLEPSQGPQRSRWLLLKAGEARLAEDPKGAADSLGKITRTSRLFPEDRSLWAFLQAGSDPWWSESITGTLDAGLGWTSNALAGSPIDPGVSGDPSGLGLIDFRGRLVPSVGASVRPAVDLVIVGHGLGNEDYRDLSTLLTAVRVGGVAAHGSRRLGFGYRAEALFLNQDPALFSEAHRAELEIEWTRGAVFFAGGGHREYRDERRTRWEGDIGFGGPLSQSGKASIVGGATTLLADAESPAYDQLGISAALSARSPVGGRCLVQADLTAVFDDYFNSGGREGTIVFGTADTRRDLLGRAAVTIWAPRWKRLQPRLEVRYTQRWSTADTTPGFDFSFREWRAVAWIRWTFAADPWAPKTEKDSGRVPLDWGLESDPGMGEDRILDLLRRDEELRRGSSCGL
jgi:hypothetical protein